MGRDATCYDLTDRYLTILMRDAVLCYTMPQPDDPRGRDSTQYPRMRRRIRTYVRAVTPIRLARNSAPSTR